MKRILAFALLILTAVVSFTSCEETKVADDQANWKERNTEFIQAIADKCALSKASIENAQKGQMFKILSFKLDSSKQWDSPSSYVYCEVIERGTGTTSPLYTDSVRINYRVRLIPTDYYPQGQVVDQSYKTDNLDPSVNIPASFQISGLVDGVATALIHMHTGDSWRLYIPYQMGYGTSDKNAIPAYSALIFELNLSEFARTGADLSPR